MGKGLDLIAPPKIYDGQESNILCRTCETVKLVVKKYEDKWKDAETGRARTKTYYKLKCPKCGREY